jgi:hypothetical protein
VYRADVPKVRFMGEGNLQARNVLKNHSQGKPSIPGNIWGMTTFFNPQRYKNRLDNYRIFRGSSKGQGLKLVAVELAFGDTPFELASDDADILVQVRSDSVMWQKERLLNIALGHLPEDCNRIVWLDADLIFKNEYWLAETAALLEDYAAVQPFQYAIRLPRGMNGAGIGELEGRMGDGERIMSLAYELETNTGKYAHPGYAWAAQRMIFENVGFYDRMILGSGDVIMSQALSAKSVYSSIKKLVGAAMWADIREWQSEIERRTNGRIACCNGHVLHLHHGSEENRLHDWRLRKLKKYGFSPREDIRLNEYGCFEWATVKAGLHRWTERYFWRRNEQGEARRQVLCCLMNSAIVVWRIICVNWSAISGPFTKRALQTHRWSGSGNKGRSS